MPNYARLLGPRVVWMSVFRGGGWREGCTRWVHLWGCCFVGWCVVVCAGQSMRVWASECLMRDAICKMNAWVLHMAMLRLPETPCVGWYDPPVPIMLEKGDLVLECAGNTGMLG